MRRTKTQDASLINRTTIRVRFSEVDSMHVVWHGEYVRYFEDGRESFGSEFGIGYLDICEAGYAVPIVELNVKYKQSLVYGDSLIIETRYIPTEAAKIQFEYIAYRESDHTIVAIANSVQVFVDKTSGQLVLNTPDFYKEWKQKWEIC
ncbi:acyl-CoA thioesterase [Massilibacteroides vaginae]|uniref:acyl-CoA thioesterase n=1 Tax=Massilibacteroides vaginae TaxID=1673718 RepID=UPI000A1CEF88|nr:acyl-CoA thioesterase [Massilibacteroides vaginae]